MEAVDTLVQTSNQVACSDGALPLISLKLLATSEFLAELLSDSGSPVDRPRLPAVIAP
jgi:hypothetical protein